MTAARRLASVVVVLFALFMWSGLEAHQAQEPSSPPAGKETTPQQLLRVRVSQRVSDALIAKRVQPQYPPEARGKHIQGMVILRAEISKEGDVTELALVSGHPLLAPAAIEAVKQWKYKPYVLNGQPIAVETQVKVAFELQPN
jgi:protein TonB